MSYFDDLIANNHQIIFFLSKHSFVQKLFHNFENVSISILIKLEYFLQNLPLCTDRELAACHIIMTSSEIIEGAVLVLDTGGIIKVIG